MGHRIELGEIECIALTLDEIQKCCCLYNEKKSHIILFCELTQNSKLDARDIQNILRKKLSNYMLPKKVVVMESLPINANGKINRQQLKEKFNI